MISKKLNANVLQAVRAMCIASAFAFGGLAMLSVVAHAADASGPGSTPSSMVALFYASYLSQPKTDANPFSDKNSYFRKYMSGALIAEGSHDGAHEADYFTKSPDHTVNPDWKNKYTIDELSNDGATAKEVLTLGAATASARVLTITVVKEGGTWRIRKVESRADS
jgi:hypothetical protein